MKKVPFAPIGVLLVGLLLEGCSKQAPPPPPPPTVEIAHPLVQRILDWDDYVGRFESLNAVELRPRVSGYLQSVNFRDGQAVRKGDLLFVIDPRPYQAVLAQASAQVARSRATLNNAQVELKRAQSLFEAKAGSEQELQARRAATLQARADLAAADANRRTAALNVEFTHVRAPLSGRVSDRRVAPGNLVSADQTLLTTIVDQNPIRFSFEASETLFLKRQREKRTSLGDPVEIRLQDEPTYRWRGKLEFVDNALDTGSGVIRGRAVVPNPSGLLTPGLFGHMRLPSSVAYDGLLIPDQAVAQDQQRQVVMVVGADNVVKQRVVVVGPLINGLRVIRSGIERGDWVVTSGTQRAKPGAKVTPKRSQVKADKADEAPPLVTSAAGSATIAN